VNNFGSVKVTLFILASPKERDMEWWIVLVILFGGFIILLATGLPVAFCLGILNAVTIVLFFHGGIGALQAVAQGTFDSVSSFVFVAVPLFILMGAVLTHTGLAFKSITSLDVWFGRIPGRLAVMGTAAGVIFGAASGSSMASTATIGQALIPQMLDQKYARWITIGSIACTGGIDMLIPPSALIVIFAGIASMPVGKLLIASIIPGIVMALCLTAFIVTVAKFKPEIAPPQHQFKVVTARDRLKSLKDLLPIGVLIVVVIVSIFAGIATPSESAAMGAFASFALAAAYRKLTLQTVKNALLSTVSVTGMSLLIITTSKVFSQVLAYTGVSRGIIEAIRTLPVSPMVILFGMNLIVFIMGCFMEPVSIMLITIPIFLPIAQAMGMDTLWWAIIIIVNIGLGLITPPFGLNLFVVRGVTPGNPDLMEVYRAIIPFILVELFGLTLMILFPDLITWLPSFMR
jgi:tripartite ATP-independent transporter DctM subunit